MFTKKSFTDINGKVTFSNLTYEISCYEIEITGSRYFKQYFKVNLI